MKFRIFLTAFYVLGSVLTVLSIGETRQPTTPSGAVLGMALAAFLIYGIWNWI